MDLDNQATIKKLSEELKQHKGRETKLEREKAYEELLRLQPSFDKLKSDEKFLLKKFIH